MDMPVISLIIPVYNVEKYLPRCLDSVLAQDYNNFECILVDDGSKDSSGQICDHYARENTVFRVFHKSNGGVSSARNLGLDQAKGKFIVFCDSDDELGIHYLSSLAEPSVAYDLVITGVQTIEADERKWFGIKPKEMSIEKTSVITIQRMIDDYSIGCIYSKRYRFEIIEKYGIKFDDRYSLAEDTIFNAQYLNYCNSVQYNPFCEYKYYKYKTDRNSLSTFNDSFVERLDDANNVIGQILSKRYPDILTTMAWKRRRWDNYYYGIFSVLRDSGCSITGKILRIRSIVKKKQFINLINNIDDYMYKDTVIWRKVVKSRSAFIIVMFWEFNTIRNR